MQLDNRSYFAQMCSSSSVFQIFSVPMMQLNADRYIAHACFDIAAPDIFSGAT